MATTVYEAGTEIGSTIGYARADLGDHGFYGSDRVGAALAAVLEPLTDPGLDYLDQVGFCVNETATGIHRMADAYTYTESDNVGEAEAIKVVHDELDFG